MGMSHPESDHGEGTCNEADDIDDVDVSCLIHTHTIMFKCIGIVKDIHCYKVKSFTYGM